jgi:hypothetical protein
MDRGAVIRHVKKLQRLKLLSPTLHFLEEGRAKRRNRRYSRQEMSYTPHKSTHTFLRALEQGEEATRGFFLMQSAASRCRMSKYFFRLPDRGLIRKYKRPRETTVAGSLSRALTTIRMQCDAVAP